MAPQEGLEPTTLRLTAEEQYKKHARTIRMRKARANEKRGVPVIGCAPLFISLGYTYVTHSKSVILYVTWIIFQFMKHFILQAYPIDIFKTICYTIIRKAKGGQPWHALAMCE